MGAVISSSESEVEVMEEEDEEEGIKMDDLVPVEVVHESDSESSYTDSSSSSSSDDDDTSFFGDSTEDESSDFESESDWDEVVEGILFGMGNPLLDLSANVGEGYLKKYGLKEDDAILADEKHIPMYQELVEYFPVEYIAGGATQNSIKVAQWILGASPRATTFVGCIGQDKFGEILKQKTEEIGVRTAYYIQNKEPTGTCAALLCNYNRSLCAHLAAANLYDKDHLDQKETWDLVEKAQYYYIAGFFMTVSQESIIEVAKHAAENGKTFMMNLSAPFLSQFFTDRQVESLPYVDILFGNETEAAAFAKVHNLGTEDLSEIASKLAGWTKINSNRPRIVVITQGHECTIVANGPHNIQKFPIIPIKNEDIVDTNGAGDAFVGGYLSQLVQGKSIEDCIRGAHFAGNTIIKQHGCTFPEKCTFE